MSRAARRHRASLKSAPPATKGATVKAISVVDGDSLSGDATVSSVVGGGAPGSRVPDLEIYNWLATKHPYVNSCISLIADTVAAEGFDIVPSDMDDAKPLSSDDDERVKDLYAFFRLAFPQTTFRAARRTISIDLNSYGFSLLRKKRANQTIAALERLDPRTVTAVLSPDRTTIDRYVVRPRQISQLQTDPYVATAIPAEDVILFTCGGGDPITGSTSPLEALDLTIAVDFAARKFRQKFFTNGGVPSMVVTMPESDDEQVKKVGNSLRKEKSSVDNAYKIWLLAGADIKVTAMSESGKNEGDFIKMSGLNREDVAGVYHVPVGMITYTANSLGSAGKGDDRMFFEQFAVLPQEEQIYEAFTLALVRDEFGIDDLALVPKRRGKIRTDLFESALMAVKFGGTGNEARRIVNLPAITDTKYDMDAPLFIGASKMGVVADEPVNPSGDTGQEPTTNGPGDAGPAADATNKRRDDEVTAKGNRPFRRR